ncbi:MAG: hypothetical protein ABJA37_06260 [Ferruginibacter sp.]
MEQQKNKSTSSPGLKVIKAWLASKKRKPFLFQQQTWEQIALGNSGLVNAPTGYGKTYSVFLGALIKFINDHPKDFAIKKK